MLSLVRVAVGCFALLLSSCSSGDASCRLRQRVDDHNIYSCVEQRDLDHEEYEEMANDCEQIAGRDSYVESTFYDGLCPSEGIVGGCDLGAGKRLWYYPNQEGYPTAEDMFVVCAVRGLDEVPPP